MRLQWPWPPLTGQDIAGIAFAVVLAIGVILALVFGPQISSGTNHGFGPEWDCLGSSQRALICVKRTGNATDQN
jgi:hypothetical protein